MPASRFLHDGHGAPAAAPRWRARVERALAAGILRLPGPVLVSLAGGPRRVDGLTLDPQVALALALRDVMRLPAFSSMSPTRARAELARQIALCAPPPRPMRRAERREAPGPHGPIPLRYCVPHSAPATPPLIVYFHGGGGVIGDADIYDPCCRELADDSGCALLSVDYRLGPEHPFPGQLDDALAAYRWACTASGALGFDPRRIAVAGDSFGAILATAAARRARDDGELEPKFQLLLYPAADLGGSFRSRELFARGFFLTRDEIAWFMRHALASPEQLADPWLSPLQAETDALRGLAPALVVTAGFDPLRDEGRAYADKLAAARTPVRYVCERGLIHGFAGMTGVIAAARQAVRTAARALGEALRR